MTLGSLLGRLDRRRTLWMVLATLAVLIGTASMAAAFATEPSGRDAEPFLAGGVLGLAGGYAVITLGSRASRTGDGRTARLVRDWRLNPWPVRLLVAMFLLAFAASAAALLLAFTGALGPARPTTLASALFYPGLAATGWAYALAYAAAEAPGGTLPVGFGNAEY